MNAIPTLIQDLERSISVSPVERQETTLRRVADLLTVHLDHLTEEQVGIFDEVIGRLVRNAGAAARTELSLRLASFDRAPPAIVRTLAQDQISVARPVLLRSERLQDHDLVAIAIAKGPAHSHAIAQRRRVPEPLGDILAASPDRHVLVALARNPGARLSPAGIAQLGTRARQDPDLKRLLAARSDWPREPGDQGAETEPASRAARPDRSAPSSARRDLSARAGALVYGNALDTVGAIALMRPLDEEDIAGFAQQRSLKEVICAIATCASLSVAAAERLFTTGDSDLILIVGRAKGWSWATVEALLRLRDGISLSRPDEERLILAYREIDPQSAERVLRVVRRRDHTQAA